MTSIIVTTGEEVPGKKIVEVLGVVKGSTVRARNIGRDIGAGFKNLIGGEIKTYTDMIAQSREEAYNRMVNEAIEKGHTILIFDTTGKKADELLDNETISILQQI